MSDCIDAVSLMLGGDVSSTGRAIKTTVKREKERCSNCGLYFADKDEAKSHWAMAHGEASSDVDESEPPVLSREEPTTTSEERVEGERDEDRGKSIWMEADWVISSSTPLRSAKFNCGDCKEAFPTLGFLFRHLQLAHDRITPEIYECRSCGDAFTKLGYRERHARKCCPSKVSKALSALLDIPFTRRRGRLPGSKSKPKLNFNDSHNRALSTLPSSSSLSRSSTAPTHRSLETTSSSRLFRTPSLALSSTSHPTLSELLPSGTVRMRSAASATANIRTGVSFEGSNLYKRPVSSSLARLKPTSVKYHYWCKTCADPLRKCSLHRHML